MIHLYLARHGETTENVNRILQGHLPGHLTDNGKAQAVILREELVKSHIPFDCLVVSDLQRTLDTAHIINEVLSLPLYTTPLLRERDWGSVTGISLAEKPIDVFPDDVESIEALFNRARRFLDYLLLHFDGQTLLAIGHGLFNRCILATVAGKTIQDIPRMNNAEIREIQLNHTILSSLKSSDVIADNQ